MNLMLYGYLQYEQIGHNDTPQTFFLLMLALQTSSEKKEKNGIQTQLRHYSNVPSVDYTKWGSLRPQ